MQPLRPEVCSFSRWLDVQMWARDWDVTSSALSPTNCTDMPFSSKMDKQNTAQPSGCYRKSINMFFKAQYIKGDTKSKINNVVVIFTHSRKQTQQHLSVFSWVRHSCPLVAAQRPPEELCEQDRQLLGWCFKERVVIEYNHGVDMNALSCTIHIQRAR